MAIRVTNNTCALHIWDQTPRHFFRRSSTTRWMAEIFSFSSSGWYCFNTFLFGILVVNGACATVTSSSQCSYSGGETMAAVTRFGPLQFTTAVGKLRHYTLMLQWWSCGMTFSGCIHSKNEQATCTCFSCPHLLLRLGLGNECKLETGEECDSWPMPVVFCLVGHIFASKTASLLCQNHL